MLRDLIKLTCTPKPLWTPAHFKQTNTALLTDAHLGNGDPLNIIYNNYTTIETIFILSDI